jgi:hypothetical protein
MLELISLAAIQKIFESTGLDMSSSSKSFYINCLMYYFKDKKATIVNSVAFEFTSEEIDFTGFKKQIKELEEACLISVNGNKLLFNNTWGKYIDKSKLDKDEKESYTGTTYSFIPVKDLKDKLLANETLIDLCAMKNKFDVDKAKSISKVKELINLFVKEQSAINKTYPNEQECAKHCINWIGKAAKVNPSISSGTKRAAID